MSNEFRQWLQASSWLEWPILRVIRKHDEQGKAIYAAYDNSWNAIIESREWMEIVEYGRQHHYQLKPCWKSSYNSGRATREGNRATTTTAATSGRATREGNITITTSAATTTTGSMVPIWKKTLQLLEDMNMRMAADKILKPITAKEILSYTGYKAFVGAK